MEGVGKERRQEKEECEDSDFVKCFEEGKVKAYLIVVLLLIGTISRQHLQPQRILLMKCKVSPGSKINDEADGGSWV